MTDDKNEREQVAKRFMNDFTEHSTQDEEYHETVSALTGLLATAFAQGDAHGYERGRKAEIARAIEAEFKLLALGEQMTALQFKYNTLAAAARTPRRCVGRFNGVESYVTDAEWHCDIGQAVLAALGPAPAPEEKL